VGAVTVRMWHLHRSHRLRCDGEPGGALWTSLAGVRAHERDGPRTDVCVCVC